MTSKSINNQTVSLVKDYLKNLVKAEVLTIDQMLESISRLKATKQVQRKTEKLISKKEAANLLGYKNTRSIDRIEKRGFLVRIDSAFIGQVRYRYSDVMKLVSLDY
jgi:hypothetical protein